jgi:hypothetical protein
MSEENRRRTCWKEYKIKVTDQNQLQFHLVPQHLPSTQPQQEVTPSPQAQQFSQQPTLEPVQQQPDRTVQQPEQQSTQSVQELSQSTQASPKVTQTQTASAKAPQQAKPTMMLEPAISLGQASQDIEMQLDDQRTLQATEISLQPIESVTPKPPATDAQQIEPRSLGSTAQIQAEQLEAELQKELEDVRRKQKANLLERVQNKGDRSKPITISSSSTAPALDTTTTRSNSLTTSTTIFTTTNIRTSTTTTRPNSTTTRTTINTICTRVITIHTSIT